MKRKLARENEHAGPESRKVKIPHPPAYISAAELPVPMSAYRTSQLRRERFKKPAACKSAPLSHQCNGSPGPASRQLPETARSHSATDLNGQVQYPAGHSEKSSADRKERHIQVQFAETEQYQDVNPCTLSENKSLHSHLASDPVISYITSARLKLSLDTRPDSHPLEPVDRGSLLSTSKPVHVAAGIKDLKMLSRRLSSLQAAMEYREKTSTVKEGSDPSGFVYCLRKDLGSLNMRYNPYDLRIVSSEKARAMGRYYTISAFTVTELEQDGSMYPTPVPRWLWEREVFQRLLNIPFFVLFKLRRSFIVWRKWILNRKMSAGRTALQRDLFSADHLLQRALLQVQQLCEEACGSNQQQGGGISTDTNSSAISLLEVMPGTTYMLEDFVAAQEEAVGVARAKLANFREAVVGVALSTCKAVVLKEGVGGLTGELEAQEEEPPHTRVLEWRGVLERLERFVRLCGLLVMQLLQRLVLKAVDHLEQCFQRSVQDAASHFETQTQRLEVMRQQMLSQPHTQDRGTYTMEDEEGYWEGTLQENSFAAFMLEPGDTDLPPELHAAIFSVTSHDGDGEILSAEPDDEHPQDPMEVAALLFQKPPEPVVPLWETRLLLGRESGKNTSEDDTEEDPGGHRTSRQPLSSCVSFTPSAMDFKSAISQLLKSYEQTIAGFSSLLKEERLLPYVSRSRYDLLMLLEEETSTKGSRRQPPWPDTRSLLWGYAPYQASVDYIERILQATMAEVERQSTHYHCFGKMAEACSQANIAASIAGEQWSVPKFQRAFALYHDQVHAMAGMVLELRVGVVRVEVGGFHRDCLSYPRAVLSELECRLPQLAHGRVDDLVGKIKRATEQLQSTPTDVESFAQYLDSVEEVKAALPKMEEELLTSTNLYNVAQEFEVSVPGEEMALYKALFPQFRLLKNLLFQAEATKSENVHQYSSDLRSHMAALLRQAMDLKNNIEALSLVEEGASESNEPLKELELYEKQLETLMSQAKSYLEYHQRFGAIPTTRRRYYSLSSTAHSWTPEEIYQEVLGVQQALKLRQRYFQAQEEWADLVRQWSKIPLESLDINQLQTEVNCFVHTVDYLEMGLSSSKMIAALRNDVVSFRSTLPTLACLLNPELRLRHWEAIQKSTGEDIGGDRSVATMSTLKQRRVFEHHNAIASISNQASHEATLEKMLKKVSQEWVSKEFTLVAYCGGSGRHTCVLGGVEELLALLEDSLTTLATIGSSKYVAPIKHAVLDWMGRLSLVLETVEQWVACQRSWLQLETIFSAADIQRQLSNEARLFLQADKSWREVMRIIADKPTALKAATTAGILEAFQTCNALLEQVFKTLEDYLESKRLAFPRLYFISNNELLDILAHVKDPFAIQPYLSKLFGNIKRLALEKDVQISPAVTAMISAEGEKIELPKGLHARGSPEQWLTGVERAMVEAVSRLMKTGVTNFDSIARSQWAQEHPGQVVLTAAQIDWTQSVERCLQSTSPKQQLKHILETCLANVEDLASLSMSTDMPATKQLILTALLTLDVHGRDVIRSLLLEEVSSVNDFNWTRHLRYYWHDDSNLCSLIQCSASFCYGNEYLGCLPRLVLTPLSERCYLTLTTAMQLHLGGSPIGPAGTGKSETIKDLAKAIGKLCLVFNCSEGLDYKMMGQFFSGLCQSGVWCCFDEFNRIDVEVLSVVAQQLQSIKSAKDCGTTRFIFECREVKLIPSCAAFITMNLGYAGRVELPDNLQPLFRPVAMVVPDTAMIAEVLLFTCGFTTAPILAAKLTKLYEMAAVQLSQEVHYDFGLRAVKSIVLLAGEFLQKEMRSRTINNPEVRERWSLLHALRDSTLPRLVSKDVQTMETLISDFFSGFGEEKKNYTMNALKGYLESSAMEMCLQPNPSQLDKCLHFYSTLMVRHGVMLLGPAGGGKSTVLKLLKMALNKAHGDYYGQKSWRVMGDTSLNASLSLAGSIRESLRCPSNHHCQMQTINPKCLSLGELYGHYDPLSLEWRSGILATTLQLFSRQSEVTIRATRAKDCNKSAAEEPDIGEATECSSAASSTLLAELDAEERKLGITPQQEHYSSLSTSVHDSDQETHTSAGLPYPSCAPVGWRWVILDGPVDPEWVENLNSTLDDSKLLCLANGERVELQPGMRVLIETDDLINASPATVSRCGIVFMDPSDLGWKSRVLTWIKTIPSELPEKGRKYLLDLFNQSMDEGLKFLKEHSTSLTCPLPGNRAVATLCHILGVFLNYISAECGGFSPQIPKATKENPTTLTSVNVSAKQQPQQQVNLYSIALARKASKIWQKRFSGLLHTSSSLICPPTPFLHRHPEALCELLGKLFVFAFTWSFGGCFESVGNQEEEIEDFRLDITRGGLSVHSKFDALVHKIFSSPSELEVKLPTSAALIYSYYVDLGNCSFAPWDKLVPSSKEIVTKSSLIQKGLQGLISSSSTLIDATVPIGTLHMATEVGYVPTVDTIRLSFFSQLLQKAGHSVLLSGKLGVGKTCLLTQLAKMTQDDNILCLVLGGRTQSSHMIQPASTSTEEHQDILVSMHISSQTKPSYLQSAIESRLVVKSKSTLTPPAGKKLVMCLDDLNMASPDAYGSQPCAELLRQLFDGRGWYDRKKLTWKEIKGVTILATAGKRGPGYHTLNQRCLNNFSVFCVPSPSPATLMHIFSTHITKAFSGSRFSPEVTESLSQLIATAIHLYHEIRSQLLPSPLKPQYTFCTRDLAKTFTGLLRVTPRGAPSREEAIHLLCHELMRVFHDRCLPADRECFLSALSEALRIHMKVVHTPSQLRERLFLYEGFTDSFCGYSASKNPRKLVKYFERIQSQYNIAKDKNSQLVFFPLACEHISRVARVLQQPGGHLLLLGMGGVGRRSAVELASYIAGCEYHQLTLGPTQNRTSSIASQYKEDLKAVLMKCGVKDQPTVLVVAQAVGDQDCLFHDIHELLVCGEVAGLFEREEVEGIASQLAEGRAEEEEGLGAWETFTKRVRRRLHLVLCFTPSSPFLAQLCRRFPGLVMHTTVDVFDEWPAKALYGVALKEIHSQQIAHSDVAAILKELQQQVASTCVKIHGSVVSSAQRAAEEHGHSFPVTPSAFIHFVQTFCRMLRQQYQKITSDCSHLEAGLRHLGEANDRVEVMRRELEELRPEIQQKTEEAELLLQQLLTEQQDVDALKEAVEGEREEIARETENVARLAEEAEADLKKVLPALAEAERGLNALKKADLLEIRSYATPPSMVMHVMSAVCVLLQQPPDWSTVKHLMADPMTFLKRLTSFDPDNIPDKVLSKLRRYSRNPNFLPEKVAHFSVACRSFCQWVLATQHYGEVYRVVQPKRQLHHKVTLRLHTVQSKLKRKEAQLEELQTQLSALQQQYSAKVSEREALQAKSELVSAQLERAEVLTNSLAAEQVRWHKTLTSLQSHCTSLVGDTLLSTACLVYVGPFSPSLRQPLVGKWMHLCQEARLPYNQGFSMETSLVESDQVQEWHAQCLPKDTHSVQNAIIVTQSERWPLIIDPQGQATRWLKAMLGGSSLTVISYRSTQLTKVLEEAVRAGLPVLIEDVPDRLDSLLEPFLLRPTASNQGQLLLRVGKTELEYNPAFRLFLVSQQGELRLNSDLSTRTSVVNFSATLEGLQDQLLSVVVSLEEPSLESQYSELLLSTAGDQRQLKALEHRLLNMLRNISGSILEDEELVQALQEAKRVAVEVEERLTQAQETQEEVTTTRHHYQPVATRGSLLYFCLLSLKHLSSMYQFSLSQFQTTFSKCIQDIKTSRTRVKDADSEKYGPDFREYVTSIIQHLTLTVYNGTSLALSTDHSLPFSFKLCCSILMHGDEVLRITPTISRAEWLTFMQKLHSIDLDLPKHGLTPFPQSVGSLSPIHAKNSSSGHHRRHATSSKQRKIKRPEFLSQEVWETCLNLEKLLPNCFSGLAHHILQNSKLWEAFATSEATQSWEHIKCSSDSNEECKTLTTTGTDVTLTPEPDTKEHIQIIFSKSSEHTGSRRSSESTSSHVSHKRSRKSSDPAGSPSSRKSSAPTTSSRSSKLRKTSEPVATSKSGKTPDSSFHPSVLSPFQQLLLKKVFHPEQLTAAVKEFIRQQLGSQYISKPLLDLGKVYQQSNSSIPILFILAPGTDPTSSLQQLSSCIAGGPIVLDSVSLGQGQGARARELVQFGAQQGRWVFLQNCHLAASWMPQLEEVIQSLQEENQLEVHNNFRLWLSSKPTHALPTTVLQASIKVSLEPPRSLKAGLQRLVAGSGTPVVGQDVFESESCGPFWRQLLFGLCLFHEAANMRKVYGTRGWNTPHTFSTTDLQVTIQLLHSLLSESPGLPWAALHQLTSGICYGGRVTDPWDRRCLEALLRKFCGPETLQEGHCYVGSNQLYGPILPSTSYSECCLLVERLPSDDPPEVCGLPPSLGAELEARESRKLQDMLHTLQFPAQEQSINYHSHDELVLEKATDLLEQLPPSIDLPLPDLSTSESSTDSSDLGTPHDSPVLFPSLIPAGPSSLSHVEEADGHTGGTKQRCPSPFWLLLVQEVSQWNSRVGVVSASLGRLTAAVKGEVPLLEETEEIYQALVSNVVPRAWQLDGLAGKESLSLSRWFHLFLECHRFLAHWVSLNTDTDWCQEPRLPAAGFWMAALCSPKGLLTAVVQDFSTSEGVAPERVELVFQVLDSSDTAKQPLPQCSIILRGLWLEGAQWSTSGELTEQSGVQTLSPLPDVLCYPTTVKESDQSCEKTTPPHHYVCPLYSSPCRHQLITSLPLTTSRQPDHWALHGVSLLAHTDHL